MIWLIALGSSLYTLLLLTLGIWVGLKISRLTTEPTQSATETLKAGLPKQVTKSNLPVSGALKSMTPLERSLEDSKEIRERIEHLLG